LNFKINTLKRTAAILSVVLFASCNSGNKIASSFNKRKYTKGYYFNSVAHRVPELPAIVASETNNQTISYKEKEGIYAKAVLSISSENVVPETKQKKISIAHLTPMVIGRMQGANASGNISYSQATVYDGIPGHDGTATDAGSSKYDGYAKTGKVLGIVGLYFLPLAIPGLILSIIGLKSETYHRSAKTGIVVSIIGIVLLIGSLALLIYINTHQPL